MPNKQETIKKRTIIDSPQFNEDFGWLSTRYPAILLPNLSCRISQAARVCRHILKILLKKESKIQPIFMWGGVAFGKHLD